MKQFTSADDLTIPVSEITREALELKKDPFSNKIGQNRTLGMIFFNPSLRTRMSTQKAAQNLGMNVIVMNIAEDGWKIEFQDGAVMNGDSQEHIKDAVEVMSQYVDILGVRTFARLKDREEDYSEKVLSQFIRYSSVPVISLESATLHPLQSLADILTIKGQGIKRPKVVLTWAPHPKALPQAVANSLLQWGQLEDINADFVLACPEGYELAGQFTAGIEIVHNQEKALENADFVYAKNWSSFKEYGQVLDESFNWRIDRDKMSLTNNGKFMHCLPVRRNVVVTDEVLDRQSIIIQQAKNREYSAQIVLKKILESI